MKKINFPGSVLLIFLFCSAALPQRNMSPPPPPLDPERGTAQSNEPTLSRHIDLLQLQKEADLLARTADTIPSDVANMRKGMLPKDVIEKLKQVEKLSKHLRSELNP